MTKIPRKRKLKKRFYVFVAITVLLCAALIYFFMPRGYVTVSNGDISYKD